MTYEEKLAIMKEKGEISTSVIEPLDYYKFIRDGCVFSISYLRFNGYKDIYEIHCTKVALGIDESVFIAEEHCNDIDDVNNFMKSLIFDKNHYKYIYLESYVYKIELDPVEIYE